ncbi:hypothetical protein H6P81_006865 [Aristolochia fimbriata]|uniref:Uncharacterized protein n=1 Tax=Aristolochia fimbriata TaxID=158543 RepID=A0AAV7F293_ARIFI|nr:hypothetical protein H6P81_006865 [Aristolochia fimbriata]
MKETKQKQSEITEEEEDDETLCTLDPDTQKERIRQIIQHQKSLYYSFSSSSSFSSTAASTSEPSSSSRTSLLYLMKGGSTSLRRLFAMEHTSLSTHFNDYSGSPIIKPIYLWGSDEDEGIHRFSPWRNIAEFRLVPGEDFGLGGHGGVLESNSFAGGGGLGSAKAKRGRRKLARTKSFSRLPGLGFWRCRGLMLRLRRLRIMICAR